MLSVKVISAAKLPTGQAAAKPAISRPSVTVRARQRLDDRGFVGKDNSGRGNIFPTKTGAFYSSPTSEAAAREGLGGAQGAGVLVGALVVVGLATALVTATGSGETLNSVQGVEVESLSAIARRIAASI